MSLNYKLPKIKYYKKLGMILNLDSHDQPGSHWVAVYIDVLGGTVEYFDSVGEPPTRNIKRVLSFLCRELTGKCKLTQFKTVINSKKFQIENTECGIYSIYYIVSRILGIPSKDIISNVIRDVQMNKYRDVLYM
jgi:Ulp1 family protease